MRMTRFTSRTAALFLASMLALLALFLALPSLVSMTLNSDPTVPEVAVCTADDVALPVLCTAPASCDMDSPFNLTCAFCSTPTTAALTYTCCQSILGVPEVTASLCCSRCLNNGKIHATPAVWNQSSGNLATRLGGRNSGQAPLTTLNSHNYLI